MEMKPEFVEMLQQLLPAAEAKALVASIGNSAPVVAVRVNTGRGLAVPDGAMPVKWCPAGFYLSGERPAFTFDPAWHAGHYYVQDASSMFIHHVITSLVDTPVRYLDLCAAPGGKATAALQSLPSGSLVVANEVVPQRARALADNVMRWGNPCGMVTSNSAADLGKRLTGAFDIIAADVPCSGEGMMRKEADAVSQWSPRLVEQCAQLQRAIIGDVWPALRPGGLFIYSTCTYNHHEDEEVVQHIIDQLGATPVEVPVNKEWGIMPAVNADFPAYRFMPHRLQGEGLFMAVLRKPGDAPRMEPRIKGKPSPADATPRRWLATPDQFVLDTIGGTVTALPMTHWPMMRHLYNTLNVLHGGTPLATVTGRKSVPHHALALSTAQHADSFANCPVDYGTALRYLRGEAITVDGPRGMVLVSHEGAVLGFANNLGNRANNLYPKGMRILSTHLPDVCPNVLSHT